MNFKLWLESEQNTFNQNDDPKIIAQKFLEHLKEQHPNSWFGEVGSGNCAWTAIKFQEWTNNQSDLLIFPYHRSDELSSAHIVPLLGNLIFDFIKHYTGKIDFVIRKVDDITQNKVIDLPQSGDLSFYRRDHERYLIAKNIADLNKILSDQDIQGPIDTFDPPKNKFINPRNKK